MRLTVARTGFTKGPAYCDIVLDCYDGIIGVCDDSAVYSELVGGTGPFVGGVLTVIEVSVSAT
jgi:hypothetical protein